METKSVADPPPAKKRCTDETMEIEHTQLPASPPPAKKDDKVFNDPIHGHIRLHPLLVKIIDTPQFQRLRYIKQLGGCYFVYPGASHNRFEHSIGVAHLAGKLIENIEREQPKLGISPCDVLCVKIAGLCHDLGHGPFSHLWDKRFHKKKWEQEEKYIKMKKEWEQEKESLKERWEQKEASLKKDREQEEESFKKEWEEEKESLKEKWEQKEKSLKKELKWEHETGSEKMLDYLIKENGLLGEYMDKNNCLTENHIQLIKRLINPEIDYEKDWPYPGLKNKSFLFEIVANKRNGVDVDKWDYFKRDCHHLGIACSFDIDRAMQFIRVVEVEGLRQICFRDKEVPNMYQLFQTRLCLHRAAYQHKTSNAVECMLTEALILADPYLKIDGHDDNGQPSTLLMSECKDKMGFFINLTDEVVQRILALRILALAEDCDDLKKVDEVDALKKSQKLLKRIQKRDLYKLVGQIHHSYELAKSFANEIPPNGELTKDDLELDIVSFDFGKKSRNPVDYIHFYRKSEPNKVIEASSRDFSKMLPKDDFQEVIIRVYCKSADKFTEAERYFIKWCEEKGVNYKASHPFGAGPHFPTPIPSSRAKPRDNTGKPKRLEYEDKKEDVQNN